MEVEESIGGMNDDFKKVEKYGGMVQQRLHFRSKLTGGCKFKMLTAPPTSHLGVAHIGAA